jgi:ubiquinone/menaquinone biosynthesis C-methylase UbiE
MLKRKLIHHRILRKWFYSRIIDAYFSECSSIIDVGCGFGDFLIVAKGKNKAVVGIDLNRSLLIALHAFGFDVVQCDVSHLPFRENSVDGAFFSHVIEHVPFSIAIAVLREIKRIIRNKLVVVTPTKHRDFWSPGHVTSYDKQKLTHVLKKAGFYVSKCFYDKGFVLRLPDREFLVVIFNALPFVWLRMNIVAVARKLGGFRYAEN